MIFDLYIPSVGNPVVKGWDGHEALCQPSEIVHQLHDACRHWAAG